MIPLRDNIPSEGFPFVTIALIVANVVMYFAFQHGGILSGPDSANVCDYGAIPFRFTHPGSVLQPGSPCFPVVASGAHLALLPLTVLTAMFMHGGIIHLAGNMLFLWIFGNNVEDAMGSVKFLAFYLLGGAAATALQIGVSPDSGIPTLGASGAIAAILGGYIVLYPRARVLTLVFIVIFFTVIELPALVMLGLWFVEQLIFGWAGLTNAGKGGGVAYFAHIGGFAFGLLAIRALARRRREVPPRYPVY